MRKAAGILLIVFGVAAISPFIVNVSGLVTTLPVEYIDSTLPYYLHINIIICALALFFITGGVLCLKRKYWELCFTSSLLLHLCMVMFPTSFLFSFPWMFFLWVSLVPVWILPLIFICLRKSEWSESQA